MKLRLPPRIKILEALGAIGDGRIHVLDEKRARVVSSDRTREYNVYADLEHRLVYSDDNGTRFRNYVGYPIIAFLMLKGVLPFDKRLAEALRGIPWRELNERFKSYATVESIVKRVAKERGVDPRELDEFIAEVMDKLKSMELIYLRNLGDVTGR